MPLVRLRREAARAHGERLRPFGREKPRRCSASQPSSDSTSAVLCASARYPQGVVGDPRLPTSTTASPSLVGSHAALARRCCERRRNARDADHPPSGPLAISARTGDRGRSPGPPRRPTIRRRPWSPPQLPPTTDGGIEISLPSCSVTGQEQGAPPVLRLGKRGSRVPSTPSTPSRRWRRGATPGDIRRHLRRPARFLSGHRSGPAEPAPRGRLQGHVPARVASLRRSDPQSAGAGRVRSSRTAEKPPEFLEAVLEASRTGSTGSRPWSDA